MIYLLSFSTEGDTLLSLELTLHKQMTKRSKDSMNFALPPANKQCPAIMDTTCVEYGSGKDAGTPTTLRLRKEGFQ
jgi:hypothetical protein